MRYADDFLLLHDDKEFLWEAKKQIIEYLATLKLELHDKKCRIYKMENGVPFLGLVVFPTHRRIIRQGLVRYKKRLKEYQKNYAHGEIEFKKIHQSIQSWIGHVKHANTSPGLLAISKIA